MITSGDEHAAGAHDLRRDRAGAQAGRRCRTPRRVEGLDAASWVLLDYGDLVVHVFLDETREYYALERLWTDAPRIAWEPSTLSS